MKNALKHNSQKFVMIGTIKGLAVEAKRARKLILGAHSNEALWSCTWRKKLVGANIRYNLLAYAFLKGMPYAKLEQKCREDNKPHATPIFAIVKANAPSWLAYDKFTKQGGGPYVPTVEAVQAWLEGAV